MRRVVCLAALGLVLGAPTAAAQDAEPIRGGGGFNDAPRLAPGSYTDSIRIGETLHYAVPLADGQQLTAEATVSLRIRGQVEAFKLDGELYSPFRDDIFVNDNITTQQDQRSQSGPMTVELTTPTASAEGEGPPGLWYFTVALDRIEYFPRPPKRQFDLGLEFQVPGAAQGAPPPRPVRDGPRPLDQREALEPRPSSAPADREQPAPETSGIDGADLLVLAVAGIGGLVGGLVFGASATMALRRRSRSRAA